METSLSTVKDSNSSLSANISYSSRRFSLTCYYWEEEYDPVPGFEVNFILIGSLNIILAIITSTLNILTLAVIYRVRHLQTPSNFFISALAIMDSCTGMISFPSHAAINFMLSAHWMSCPLRLFLTFTGYFFGSCGLLTLIVIATDRYFAVFHPYAYGRLTTERKQIAKPIALAWSIALIIVALSFLTPKYSLYITFIVITLIILLIWSVYSQGRILKATRKIIREIIPIPNIINQSDREEMEKIARKMVPDVRFSRDNMTCEGEMELESIDANILPEEAATDHLHNNNKSIISANYDSISISSGLKSNLASNFFEASPSTSRPTFARISEVAIISEPEIGVPRKRSRLKSFQRLRDIWKEERKETIRNAKENFNAAKLTVSVVAAQYIFYIPHGIILMLYFITPVTTTLHVAHGWTATLSLLNSMLNPIIYCWQLKGFMRAARTLLLNRDR